MGNINTTKKISYVSENQIKLGILFCCLLCFVLLNLVSLVLLGEFCEISSGGGELAEEKRFYESLLWAIDWTLSYDL